MKTPLLFTVALLLAQSFFFYSNLFAQASDFLWAKKGGNSGQDYGMGIAVDPSGNSYVTGMFTGSATFGNITLSSNGFEDMFITKYDASGNVLWAKNCGGSGYDSGYGVAVDASGNSYVTGTFKGTATFGNTTLISSGLSDIFIIKYDPSGNLLWARRGGGTGDDSGLGLAVDASGNTHVTGIFEINSTFGNTLLIGNGDGDMFIAKYDATGNVLWAKSAGGANNELGRSIALDAFGNSYVTGQFHTSTIFGNTSLIGNWTNTMFVAKFDTYGNMVWAKKGGGSGGDLGNSIAVDASGNSYVIADFLGSATFGNTTLTSSGDFDIYIIKYDALGNVLWVRKEGGTSGDSGTGITLDALGNCYIVSNFGGTFTFGSNTLTSSGNSDILIAKYDTFGNFLWVYKGGGAESDYGRGIALDAFGNSYVTGFFQGSATFGNTTLTSSGLNDMFVAKIGPVVSGLEENAGKANIQVHPNPFTSTFSIALPEPTVEPLLIRITDVLGREVYRQTLSTDAGGVVSVTPSKALTAGFYQLQVQTAKASFTKKLVVE